MYQKGKLTIIMTVFASKIGISKNPNEILVTFLISQGHIIQICRLFVQDIHRLTIRPQMEKGRLEI